MTIYEKIKRRRKELQLTADEVAEALGVSRATVYRYESEDIEKLPITSIEPLAAVLHCSPAYLMGWEEEDPQQKLLQEYALLNDEGQKKVAEYIADLVGSGRYSKEV